MKKYIVSILFLSTCATSSKFKFGQPVKVTNGFYEGSEGHLVALVIDYASQCHGKNLYLANLMKTTADSIYKIENARVCENDFVTQ